MPDGRISQDVTVAYKAGLLLPAVDMTLAAGAQNVNITAATLAASAGTAYVLPTASTSVLGGVKVDGASVTVSAGVLSAIGLVSSVAGRTGDVVLAVADVSGAAPSANPTFTGVVALPATTNGVTPTAGTNTTQIATTQFVTSAVSAATAGVASFNTRTGAVTLSSGDVTTALTYTPYNATNPTGYQTAAQVATSQTAALAPYLTSATASGTYQPALGFTPYNATNPTGYQTAANVMTALTPFALTSSVAALAPVQSVSSRTGSVVLTHSDLTDWASATAGFGAGSTGVTNFGGVTGAVTLGVGLSMAGNTVNVSAGANVASFNARTGAVTLSSSDVTTALSFTPYSNVNSAGYQTAGQVATSIAAAAYTLPVASTVTSGGIKPDGSTVTVSAGVLSAIGPVSSVAGRTGSISLAVADISGAAPLLNPSFSGVVSLPATTNAVTSAPGTATTAVATTAFVGAAVSSATVGVSSFNARTGAVTLSSGDVTGALAYVPYNISNPSNFQSAAQVSASQSTALGPYITSATAGSNLTTALASYAPLASPALSGVPTAPTASAATNSTQVASTAYVQAKMSYLAPGAGAVSRTIASKLGDVVSVVDYGATGNGVTDDTAAINAAAATGKSLYFPAGTYNVTALNGPVSGQYFTGAGTGATTVQSTTTGANVFLIATGTGYAGITDMTIGRTVTPISGVGIKTAMSGTNDAVSEIYLERLHLTNHWVGLLLGPTDFSMVRDVVVEKCLNDGVTMINTVGTSGSPSMALQWTFDHLLCEFCNGFGISVKGVSQAAGAGTPMPLGEWINVSTFGNSAGGASIAGTASCCVSDVRIGSNSFFGADGGHEIALDTYGTNHIVSAFIELAGTGPTGVNYTTAATHVGRGIIITANNGSTLIHDTIINGCSHEGISASANLYGANTGPVIVSSCQITNNGLAGLSGAQSGIMVVAGGLVVSGGMIGQWNTAPGTGTQLYGITTAVDNIAVSGCRFFNNATAAINPLVTLTSASYRDPLAGGASGGVTGFNGRGGAVTLTNADVISVLGTPLFFPATSGITGPGAQSLLMQADGMALGMNNGGLNTIYSWSTAGLNWTWTYGGAVCAQLTSTGKLAAAGGIVGTVFAGNASAGIIGEYVSGSVASTSPVALTTAVIANVTSISLTAGDWDVQGTVGFVPAASTVLTTVQGGINTTSATFSSNPDAGGKFVLQGSTSGINNNGGVVAFSTNTTRVNVASTTTVYLVAYAAFSGGTCGSYGFVAARRVR